MTAIQLAATQAGTDILSGPNAVDRVFAYGALMLLVALVVWNVRSQGPP